MALLSNEKSTSETLMLEMRRFIAGVILFNQQVAEEVGMNPTDMQCIHLLQLMGPMTAGKLAECTRLTTGGVTVALDRMEKAGLVRRERNPGDRRSVLVHLEPQTLAHIESHYGEIGARTAALLQSYPERDLKTVLAFFTRMNSLGNAPTAKPGVATPRSER
jgi:DNA-binding MarR family transcriptional regulator